MIELEQPTSAQEMRNTRLMIGMPEAAVRRPPIAREHAREILAEDGGRIHKSAAGPNCVDRGVGRGERPERLCCMNRTWPATIPPQLLVTA